MKYAYCLDPFKKPDQFIGIEETIKVISENAFGGDANNETELENFMRTKKHHPLVGPIYVNGVKAGMNIEIQIINIEPNCVGYQCCSRSSGIIKLEPFKRNLKRIFFSNGMIKYDDILLAASPSIGVIGTATKMMTRSGRLDSCGGNIDLKELKIGSKIILPCEFDGALIYLGDMHLIQGNGEISGIAAEVGGTITFRVNISDYDFNFPIISTEKELIVIGYGVSIDESIHKATKNAIHLLCKKFGMNYFDAYMILGLIGNILLGHSTGKIVSSGVSILKEQLQNINVRGEEV